MAKNKAEETIVDVDPIEAPKSSNVPEPVIPVTKETLMTDLQTAMSSNDWQSVAKIGANIAKHEASIKRQEREQLETEVIDLAAGVQLGIENVIESELDNPIMEKCAGVWYSWDFATGLKTIRLLSPVAGKTTTKSVGSAGSVGKKFDVTTTVLLSQFGGDEYKDGKTFQQFHDDNTGGNARYVLRTKLLKLGGYTS